MLKTLRKWCIQMKQKNDEEKSIIKELEEIQAKLSNIVIPSMGMIENDIKIEINNEKFINTNNENDK